MILLIKKSKDLSTYKSDTYNWIFNSSTGFFARWGKTINDNPQVSPIGPEIADIEISTVCDGINGIPCTWCYKSNNSIGDNMTLSTFDKIVKTINPYGNLKQIALGIGSIDANPDLVPILMYCREHNIVPNITVNGAKLENKFDGKTYLEWLSSLCGAVAVSHYNDDICFNAVKALSDSNLKQINIHQILAAENIDECIQLLDKKMLDKRLKNLNNIIFLSLKQKGKRNTLHVLTDSNKYQQMIEKAIDNHINIGFDSCGASRFIKAIKNKDYAKFYDQLIEPCEADCFSFYVNVNGIHYPCSFCENETNNDNNWKQGINILDYSNNTFISKIWNNKKVNKFRTNLYKNHRNCIMFNV